jgi:DNA-binding MarR family transcriptional regulator
MMCDDIKSNNESVEMVEEQAQELMRHLDLLIGNKVQDDLSFGQYKVMALIHAHGAISVGKLGRLVGSAQSTTSEMVARLTKSNLVAKVRGPYDGRVVMVELTDQGRQLMRRRRKIVRDAYQSLFDKLTVEDRRKFVDAIRVVNSILSNVE